MINSTYQIILTTIFTAVAHAQVCTSLTDKGTFGMTGIAYPQDSVATCPENHAYMAIHLPRGIRRAGQHIQIWGNCCPLPTNSLLDEHSYALEECPAGFIATGARQTITQGVEEKTSGRNRDPMNWRNVRLQYMRCTKVNQNVLSMGQSSKGIVAEFGHHFREMFEPHTSRARIPLALRFGIGRIDDTEFTDSVCLALPWGSALTAKRGRSCRDLEFVELHRVDGLPLVPRCKAIKSPLAKNPECLQ